MKRCTACRRHVRHEEHACPFCGKRFAPHARLAAVALSVGVAGCGPTRGLGEDADATATEGASTTRSGGSDPATSTTSDSTTSGSTTSSDPDSTTIADTDEPQTTSAGFIYGAPTDWGPPIFECDVWAQDCPEDYKCAPWDITGEGSWNATRCVPVDPDPAQTGEPCRVEGSPVSGFDDCDHGLVCWKVDPDTLEGICIAQCQGSEPDPICPGDLVCSITHSGALTLCLEACDPLVQDCPEGEGCYGAGPLFVCMPEPSQAPGGYGQPCDEIPGCDAGFFCAGADMVPECFGSVGCCTSFCDLADADPDATCAAFAVDMVCVPWFEPDTAPEGYEDIGACILPD